MLSSTIRKGCRGPAGLAAAHQLRIFGHKVTIYEKASQLGGLNVTGVAPYKMRSDTALEEVDYILGIGGIEVVTGMEIDAQNLRHMVADHDAVFVAIGLGPDSTLGVPGEELANVSGAVRWIEGMKAAPLDVAGVTHAAVIGGGHVL